MDRLTFNSPARVPLFFLGGVGGVFSPMDPIGAHPTRHHYIIIKKSDNLKYRFVFILRKDMNIGYIVELIIDDIQFEYFKVEYTYNVIGKIVE